MIDGLPIPALPVLLAHGLPARPDLPVPAGMFHVAAAIILVVSFALLGGLWRAPRWAHGTRWHPLPLALDRVACGPATLAAARAATLGLLVLVTAAAALGTTEAVDNLAPIFIFAIFWIGLLPAAALVGDVFGATSPWRTLACLGRLGSDVDDPGQPARDRRLPTVWPAAVGVAVFSWLELVYPTAGKVRLLALLIVLYTLGMLLGSMRRGAGVWSDGGEMFATLSQLFASMSPLQRRAEHGSTAPRLGIRTPVAGALEVRPRPGLVAIVTLLIGTISYDGLSRTRWWVVSIADTIARLGDAGVSQEAARIVLGTFGMVVMCLIAWGAYELAALTATRVGHLREDATTGRSGMAFAPTLLPIALAYVVAHYVTFFAYQGQEVIRLASDPFGTGLDLFGTADRAVSYSLLSSQAVWYIQVGSIVVGHVAGLVLAHDRSLTLAADHRQATRSQLPLLALMVLYTVGGLYFLSEGMT